MSLEGLRLQINAIDARIVGLLAQRARLAKEAARLAQGQVPIESKDRQEQIIQHVRYMAEHQGLSPNVAERIYRTILSEFAAMEKREAGL
ncbi:chorismate mutase [Meiothermus taiwanensis]|uniref:Chorismate mutase n=1 Tax=Meiothermus taiwanensis WR-220 TaxID=1339250 RepID=A0ABM6WEW1_9DEIN|nr:chorismate mutase [Meiothermus taiwanensis]AWR85419.1 chorismate mutase [Meiothermus taiwanensis WR-220]KIQ54002.1 chorismate mutase [Meiothermus taiwanensis]KZK15143.1 chorismate mutase [Meiothermus taiwanensis]